MRSHFSKTGFRALFHNPYGILAASLATVLLGSSAPAHAQLTIIPTYDSTITNDPHAAQIKASINSALALYNKVFTNPTTVNIYFKSAPMGLGTSISQPYLFDYSEYRNALLGESSIAAILAPSLPATGNPVPGNPTAGVAAGSAQARTLGLYNVPVILINGVLYDSEIFLNTSIMNLSRTGPQDPDKYDIVGVVEHEVNEVLGLGSALNGQSNPTPPNNPVVVSYVGPLDFFRYAAIGNNDTVSPVPTHNLSFNNDANAVAYLSLDGGTTILNFFNQQTGGDFHDWASQGEAFDQAPQPQTAASSPGVDTNLGVNELLALQAVGYNLATPVLTNVTAQITGNMTAPIYNRATALYNQRVTITITGGQPLLGPISLVLSGLTSGVTLTNATGTTGGSPYIIVTPNAQPTGSVLTVNLQFRNPANAIIGYTPSVLAGGRPN